MRLVLALSCALICASATAEWRQFKGNTAVLEIDFSSIIGTKAHSTFSLRIRPNELRSAPGGTYDRIEGVGEMDCTSKRWRMIRSERWLGERQVWTSGGNGTPWSQLSDDFAAMQAVCD